jgi:hypothetical protein
MIILNAMDGNNEESNNIMVSEFDSHLKKYELTF